MGKRKLYWGAQITGWATFTIGNLVYNYLITGEISPVIWFYSVLIFVLGVTFSHFIRFVFKMYGWHKSEITLILHKIAILSALVGGFHISVLYLLRSLFDQGWIDRFTVADFFGEAGTFGTIYFIWGIIYSVVYFFRNFKKEEIKNLQQQSQLKEIQLNKFKSQLNPHFIFNSMNGLRSLIDEDTNKAKEGITQLSNILRHTLTIDRKPLIYLDEELKIVEDYLSLEKIRLEERLDFRVNATESALHFQVPPMIIQTLAENAIKHGVSQLVRGGHVNIDCMSFNGTLNITIINSGQFKPENKKVLEERDGGFGLENSKQRLEFLFGDAAKFEIRNLNDNEVITEIEIPRYENVNSRR